MGSGSSATTCPGFAHAVGERPDSRCVDVADKLEPDGIGVAAGVAYAEVEIQGEPSLIACVQLAQRGAALEDQHVKAALLVQIAKEQPDPVPVDPEYLESKSVGGGPP